MVLSHRFGSPVTLGRALYWLGRLGFEVSQSESEGHDPSRLSVHVDFSRFSAALALIDSIERGDPEGYPGLLDATRSLRAHAPESSPGSPMGGTTPKATPIAWKAREERSSVDPVSHKVSEYMFSRWE